MGCWLVGGELWALCGYGVVVGGGFSGDQYGWCFCRVVVVVVISKDGVVMVWSWWCLWFW